jgi:hypothetical protein
MGISGPITTVRDEHICHELPAVARISLVTRRWLSETSRSAAVALGNHQISVRRIRQEAEGSAIAITVLTIDVY